MSVHVAIGPPITRPPAVAGSFYPDDPAVLRATIEELLSSAPPAWAPSEVAARGCPKAIIAPHAAYRYSGPVAASAYRALQPCLGRIERVVLLGPAHRFPAHRMIGSAADRWATPLGTVDIDTRARDELARRDLIDVDDEPHRAEHSLEVQLPFLQVVLGWVKLLPLLIGAVPSPRVAEVLEAIAAEANTCVVVSTDLSHYYDQVTARRLDRQTAVAICAPNPWGVDPGRACGIYAVRGLLEWVQWHHRKVSLIDLRTSGDITHDVTHVVGYGAFTVS